MTPIGNPASSSTLPPHLPVGSVSAAVPRSQQTLLLQAEAVPSDPKMDWKKRGDFHLARNEADLAIESYTKALQEAEKHNIQTEIVDNLKNLGRAYLAKGQLVVAAKIFNGAFALCQKHPDEKTSQAILLFMSEVERTFLQKECKVTVVPKSQVYLEQRQQLKALRQVIRTKIEQNCPCQQILRDFSQGISTFLEGILQQIYPILGKPPCEFTFIGLGSLGRKEMSPYSDLEFALLVRESSQENLLYFRKLVKWLEIRVINLGETEFRILNRGYESPTCRGFSFDDGGNTPLGKQGYVELIKAPQDLAQFQSERFYGEDLILSNVLRTAGVLMGSEALHQEYTQAMQSILSKPSAKKTLTVRQERALNIINGHLFEFEPQVDRKKEETPVFNIKTELYRLPSFLISGLADYFGIEEQNTWDKLDALAQRKILSEEGIKNLKSALIEIMQLRIRCHLHYGRECDEAFHPAMKRTQSSPEKLQRAFILSDGDIEKIIGIFRVILPLHRVFKEASRTANFRPLSEKTFYDNSLLAQAQAYEKLTQYLEATQCYQQALALNPDDGVAQFQFAQLLFQMAQYDESRKYANKAQNGSGAQNAELLCAVLSLQGFIHYAKGEHKSAIEHHTKALEIRKKRYGAEHPHVATCLTNIGLCYDKLGKNAEAMRHDVEALKIRRKMLGNRHPAITQSLNNLGNCYYSQGNYAEAFRYHTQALQILREMWGDMHPDVAQSLNNLGNCYFSQGKYAEAERHFTQAVDIRRKTLGNSHPDLAQSLNNLGCCYYFQDNNSRALDYHMQAFEIWRETLENRHPDVAMCLSNIGSCYRTQGKYEEALNYNHQALEILTGMLGNKHPDVAVCLNNIGLCYRMLGNDDEALRYYMQALEIRKEVLPDRHPDLASSLNNIGSCYTSQGKYEEALRYYTQALEIRRETLGEQHPNTIATLNNIEVCKTGQAGCQIQ